MAIADGFHVDTSGNLWLGSDRETFDSTTQSEAKFYVQADGTMVAKAGASFAGDLSAAGGTFTGTLSGVDGTFTGTISASNVTGGTLDFSSVTAGNLDFSSLSVTSTQIINTIAEDAILGKISDGAISQAKLGNISADKITSGTINATFIDGGVLDMDFNINGLNLNADHSISAGGKIEATGNASGLTDAGDVIASGNVQTGDRLEHKGATSTTYIDIGQTSSFFFRPNGTTSGLLLSANGESYIRSDFRPNLNNTYGLGSSVYKWTDVWAVDGTINTSDITLKTDVETTTLGLDFIDTLTPIEFKWADGGVRTHLGFSAQDVKQKLIDAKGATQNYAMYVQGSYDTQNDVVDEEGNLVEEIPEDFETYGLRPQELIPVLTKAIQELSAKNDALESRIAVLEG